jgi:hypothetical protein
MARGFRRPNLKGIIQDVQKTQRWTPGRTRTAELWYYRFLELAHDQGRRPVFAMARDADTVWHAHILSSRRYREYCEKVFGGYLDHIPLQPAPRVARARLQRANAMYLEAYGQTPPQPVTCCYLGRVGRASA